MGNTSEMLDLCESPIERDLLVQILKESDERGCDVTPQLEVAGYRIDIAIVHGGIRLAVEADGFDFHERTPQQAEHDRSRDRVLVRAGWTVLRFTGSEVRRDAAQCAAEVWRTLSACAGDRVVDAGKRTGKTGPVPLSDIVSGVAAKLAVPEADRVCKLALPTGFKRLDAQTAGLNPGDLVVIAGRPSMGKTAFALDVSMNIAAGGHGVLFCSLEMQREQIAARLISSACRVELAGLRAGSSVDLEKIARLTGAVGGLEFWVDDSHSMSLADVRARGRALQSELVARDTRLDVIVVDYLQIMKTRRGSQSREQEVSELSRGLKEIARELQLTVVALSQLNRAIESREVKDKRPQLSDLRESGSIEADADVVMFIYRDEYYNKDSQAKGVAEIIVAKQRNGPTGTVLTRFTSAFTRFDNLEGVEIDQFDEFDNFGDAAGGAWP